MRRRFAIKVAGTARGKLFINYTCTLYSHFYSQFKSIGKYLIHFYQYQSRIDTAGSRYDNEIFCTLEM